VAAERWFDNLVASQTGELERSFAAPVWFEYSNRTKVAPEASCARWVGKAGVVDAADIPAVVTCLSGSVGDLKEFVESTHKRGQEVLNPISAKDLGLENQWLKELDPAPTFFIVNIGYEANYHLPLEPLQAPVLGFVLALAPAPDGEQQVKAVLVSREIITEADTGD